MGRTALDVSYPYLALCVAGASAANVRTAGFYLGLCLLVAWALWPVRSRAVSWPAWAALLAAAAGLGYAGHVGLHALQGVVEAFVTEWVLDSAGRDRDPFRNHTALGTIGRLKLSDRILLRVDTGGRSRRPCSSTRRATTSTTCRCGGRRRRSSARCRRRATGGPGSSSPRPCPRAA